MKRFIKCFVCLLITLLLLSCNNDEVIKNQESVNNAKKDLKLSKFSNPNIVSNVEVDFENVREFRKDSFKISEIPAKEKVINNFQSNLLQSQLKYQGITIEYENKAYSYFLEIYSHKSSAVYSGTITNLKSFSGTFNVYSFEGENLGSVGLFKGTAKNISQKEDLNILTKTINLFSENSNLTNRIAPCGVTYWEPMQFMVGWYTETIVDNKPISFALVNVSSETIFVEMSYPCDVPQPIVTGGYRSEIIGHSGAGASISSDQVSSIVIDREGDKIDPSDENKCFDKTKSATLTIYVQQPNENTRDKMGENSVGHTFIGIKQGDTQRVIGFYPDSAYASLISSQNSELHDNSNTMYHVSISVEIDSAALARVIAYINDYSKTYDLNNYNCSDFGIMVAQRAGLYLPKTSGSYDNLIVKFKGRNPGDLGQDIRNMSTPNGATKSTTKGNAPKKKGNC